MCIYSCVTLSTTLLIRAVQFNARSACDASMFTSCILSLNRLYDWLHRKGHISYVFNAEYPKETRGHSKNMSGQTLPIGVENFISKS